MDAHTKRKTQERAQEIRNLDLKIARHREIFQTLVDLVADTFGCPIALLSIVAEDEQWFLAKHGIDAESTPISDAFCAMAIEVDGTHLLVNDARKDPYFCTSKLVTGSPHIRSYLGVPVRSPTGIIVGSICAIHTEPNTFSERQGDRLRKIADLAEHALLTHVVTRNLEAQNKAFEQAERAAKIGSWMVDLQDEKLHWSKETFRIHALPFGTQLDINKAIDFYIPEDRPVVRDALERALGQDGVFEFEATITAENGETKRVFARGERIDHNGVPERLVGVFHDITDFYFQKLALEHAARCDRLTELHNRAAFDDQLRNLTGRKFAAGSFVGLVDLDGFKDINDEHGHLIGDMVLQQTAKQLRLAAPTDAFVARWGGDEFALLFPPSFDECAARALASGLIEAIGTPIHLPSTEVRIGATIGIARIEKNTSAQEIVRRADLAMYVGKKGRVGGVYVYDSKIEDAYSQRTVAIRSIAAAIDEKRVFVGYQPIVDLQTRKIKSFEALLRFVGITGGIVTAGEVQPAFLDPSTCRRVGDCVQRLVSDDLPRLLPDACESLRVAINVSEAELLSRTFARDFVERQRAAGLSPTNLTVEVTETMLLVNDAKAVKHTLDQLVESGVQVALDDFGTGFSSLSHLRDYPISSVKIDRTFVSEMLDVHQSRLIVQAIIGMARNLGLATVAEGVETEEQANLLQRMGCDLGQGYLFSPAMTVDRASLFLQSANRTELRAVG